MSIANLSLRENWVGLESNPEVLTEYAHKMGVSKYGATASRRFLLFCRFLTFYSAIARRSWGFSDVFGLDEDALKMVPSPCVGIVFLYPYSQVEMRKKQLGASRGKATQGVWFMDQTIGNACGAVALMHTVMNCSFLKKFRGDSKDQTARQRGELFGTALRGLHDEVSGRGQTEAPKPNADLDFHFISLVPVRDR